MSIDLENFFSTIKANKVYTLFTKLGYNSLAATILTNLCTLNDELPQGGICSPSLSNLICITLDKRIIGLCNKRGIRYTRYADDMYFSCDDKDLLKQIYPIIRRIINDEGFIINNKKLHFHTPANRKQITGIVIYHPEENIYSLKASRILKRNVRCKIYNSIMQGNYVEKDKIKGIISYISYIEDESVFENDQKYINKIKKYIQSCANKVINSKELVNAYNNNKFYKNMPDIQYIKEYCSNINNTYKYYRK
jgi:retron-type reverse transcriptase